MSTAQDEGPDGLALWDLTAGATYQVGKNAALKAELRYDKADADIFNPADPSDSTITAHLAALASF